MSEKTKNKIIVIGFVSFLFIFLIANIIKKDERISIIERRVLSKFPIVSLENIYNGKFSEDLDKYTTEQFIFRDTFIKIKSFWSKNIYRQKDNNGLFLQNESICKIEYPLNRYNVINSANSIKNVCDKYLKNNKNIYYSIIPDKTYYLQSDYLKIDINEVQGIMNDILKDINYIDITKDLDIEDYYKTDFHWKQENLKNVVNKINSNMNLENNFNYEIKNLGDFYGAYYGQLGVKMSPDKIKILTNDIIENSLVYNYGKKENQKIYDMEKWKKSSDKYDVYLSGATPLLTIENPKLQNGKELILFRDSFGSSIAPLFLENYSKIILVDLRYISSKILDEYIKFKNQDVLFLYNILILNQNVLK